MAEFTKEQLIAEVHYNLEHCYCSEKTKRLMEIALASLTEQPVGFYRASRHGDDADEVLARVYGATPQEANNRAVALARRTAMLQGAEPVQEWIPCSERMPEAMVSVLATGDWFDYAVTAWSGKEWLDFDDYEPPVTHWMPLPSPPNQSSES